MLGAVARLAEGAYERLDATQREAARRILLRLAGEGGVRVRVPLADLPGDVQDVLSVLASDRLITVGEGEVEVAHEALLREWPRLRAWLDEDADGRRVHRHLTEAARGWDAGGRDADELYRGSRLVAASEWAATHDEDLNTTEREFLAASRAASEAEAERRRRANRRLRALLAGVATLLVLAVVAGAIALSQRGQAREAALTADAQRLGAEALTNERLDQALLLARAGVELDDSTATRSNLLALLVRDPASLGELRGDGWPLYAVALSDDDRLVAIGDERGGVIVYDTATRSRLSTPYRALEGLVQSQSLVFSPDGRLLAAGSWDGTRGRTLVWDVRTGDRTRVRLGVPGSSLAFSPDGRLLAANGDEDPTEVRDTRTGRVVARLDTGDNGRSVAFSPDGELLAIGHYGGSARLVSTRTWKPVGRTMDGQEARLTALEFSPDGRVLATGSAAGTVLLWNVDTERAIGSPLEIEPDAYVSATFARDGSHLFAVPHTGRGVRWDVRPESWKRHACVWRAAS